MTHTELLQNLLQPDKFQVYIRTFNTDKKFIKELENPDSR